MRKMRRSKMERRYIYLRNGQFYEYERKAKRGENYGHYLGSYPAEESAGWAVFLNRIGQAQLMRIEDAMKKHLYTVCLDFIPVYNLPKQLKRM